MAEMTRDAIDQTAAIGEIVEAWAGVEMDDDSLHRILMLVTAAHASGYEQARGDAVAVCKARSEFEGRMAARFGNYTIEAHETRQDEASSLASAIAALSAQPPAVAANKTR